MNVATRRSVNAALRREQIPLEFVTTREGYQYFVFDDGVRYETHSEPVCYVHHLTVQQWVARAREALRSLAAL
jgi:hypothetical protein